MAMKKEEKIAKAKELLFQLAEMKSEMKQLKKEIEKKQKELLEKYNIYVPKEFNTEYGTLHHITTTEYEVTNNKKLLDAGFEIETFIENAKITPKRVKEIKGEDMYKKLFFLNIIQEKNKKEYFSLK